MTGVPVAFYAPLKAPDHAHPSGDRAMARLLIAALSRAGFAPANASRLRTYEPQGDEVAQRALAVASRDEAARLVRLYRSRPTAERPRLWFTYHCYYKAPDHIGPAVSRALGVPYAIAEASSAPKRAEGPWGFAHAAAEAAIRSADTLFIMTRQDREILEHQARPGQALVELPPFLDASAWAAAAPRGSVRPGSIRLLSVAMMRAGDKLASYRLLAAALALVDDLPWALTIVGDGPARPEVEALFAGFQERVVLAGRLDGPELRACYAEADLFVWPAVNEAYGMVLLEAQAMGCPVVAGRFGGVPDVVLPGVTGVLAEPGDPRAFSQAVAALVTDPDRRRQMGKAAEAFVRDERNLDRGAEILGDALRPAAAAPSAA